jgi:hypothetical protein
MIDDAHLEEVLASIGPLLVLEPAAVTAVTPELAGSPRRWRRWIAGGAAAAVLAIGGLSPLRGAVADWLGIGSTQVEVRPDPDAVPASLPGIADGAMPISPRQAAGRLEPQLLERLDDTELGAPAGYALIPEGGVLVVWSDRTTLWVHGSRMGVDGWLEKLVATDQQVQRVDDLGDDALAVLGDHVLETPDRTVRAGTTVLWTRGATELRLAGDRPLDELVEAARVLDGG